MSNAQLISSALYLTDEKLFDSIDGGNSWLSSLIRRGARVKLYRAYEKGDSRSSMTTSMRKMLRLIADEAELNNLDDNYAAVVVDKMAGRVSAEISANDDTIDKKWLEPLLTRQDFQAAEGMWWRGAIRDGDAFVMIDPVTLLWSSEPAFDGFSGMTVIYNQITRRPVWGCKMWSESDTQDKDEDDGGLVSMMHLVVYQPDKISYWIGREGTAEVEPLKDEESGENVKPWPAEFKGSLPFVSFANQRDNYTRYGESELRTAIPLQDVLNRTMYSMVMASEFSAFPMNWSIGMNIDPSGIVPGGIINLVLRDAAGALISEYTQDMTAFLSACKVGQFAPTDIGQYTRQIETVVREISQATQTPIYGVTANGAISGDALKQLEIGLIGKVLRFQRQNKDALQELILLTAKMERVFKPELGTPDVKTVQISWKSPELLDNNVQITALIAMWKDAPGLWPDSWYQEKIGKLMGMSKDDIANEQEKLAEEEAAKPTPPPAVPGNTDMTDNLADQPPTGQPTPGQTPPQEMDMAKMDMVNANA